MALLGPTRLLISEKSATYTIKWSYTIIWQVRVQVILTEKSQHIQGVPTQTFILHFALADRNMQVRFGLKVFWEF